MTLFLSHVLEKDKAKARVKVHGLYTQTIYYSVIIDVRQQIQALFFLNLVIY